MLGRCLLLQSISQGNDPGVFYRNLITSGQQGVNAAEIKEYELPRILGYMALSVSFDIKDNTTIVEEDDD